VTLGEFFSQRTDVPAAPRPCAVRTVHATVPIRPRACSFATTAGEVASS
jgi:hypothetical protein